VAEARINPEKWNIEAADMKKFVFFLSLILVVGILSGCASQPKHHQDKLPDPKSFNAHFPDMDSDGDDLVSWKEFQNHFPQAGPEAFKATDLNGDGNIDHDEWHQFKEAHGLGHVE
jgi:hypothetical protein